ncbi:unnamed protein product, partial [Phaeothamnion confervicola]
SASKNIVVRPSTPNVIDVTAAAPPADGTYGTGEEILLNVTFGWSTSELTPVELLGSFSASSSSASASAALLWLRTGPRVLASVWGAHNGSSDLVLASGHLLTADDIGRSLTLRGGGDGSIGGGGGDSNVTLVNLTWSGAVEARIDPPYTGTDVVDGVPAVNLTDGVTDADGSGPGVGAAEYWGGNGSVYLLFRYVVQPGDSSADLEYAGTAALQPSAGLVLRRVGAALDGAIDPVLPAEGVCQLLRGCSLGANRDIRLDTAAPTVLNVTTTKPVVLGPYPAGEQIDITVAFSAPVTVGTRPDLTPPRLRMGTGGYATYNAALSAAADANGRMLTFIYTVSSSDYEADLECYDAAAEGELSALTAWGGGGYGGGYIRRAANPAPATDADLRLPAPGDAGSLSGDGGGGDGLALDTGVARPVLLSTTTADGRYGVGQVIEITVHFSEPVWLNVTDSDGGGGFPMLYLNSGGAAVWSGVEGVAGNATAQLFEYVVTEGESAPALDVMPGAAVLAAGAAEVDLTITTALCLNGSRFVDAATGRPAAVVLPRPPAAGALSAGATIEVDTAAPRVLEVMAGASIPDGTYGVGEEILILVRFDAPVVVPADAASGLELWLDLGDVDVAANGSSTSAGSWELAFLYTVEEGHYTSDLDYTTPWALTAGSSGDGYILRDSTVPTQSASLLLPRNGQEGSLGLATNIRIDTTAPAILTVTAGVTRGALAVAGRRQAVDVRAPAALEAGGFRLRYGPVLATSCLPVGPAAAAVNATVLQGALKAALSGGATVSVTEDAAPCEDCRRFTVDFDEPTTGLQPLVADVTACPAWSCGTNVSAADCGIGDTAKAGVEISTDATRPPPGGVVELVVLFDRPVAVNATAGAPFLLLQLEHGSNSSSSNASFATTAANWTSAAAWNDSSETVVRAASYSAGLVQFVDVGVNAAALVTAGQFRLMYANETTDCIDVMAAQAPAAAEEGDPGFGSASLQARLQALPSTATPGIKNVTRTLRGNGFRFRIEFRPGLPAALTVPAVGGIVAGCVVPFDPALRPDDGDGSVVIPDTERVSFIYEIAAGDKARTVAYTGADALHLGGATVRRSSTNPLQDANITLPATVAMASGAVLPTGPALAIDCSAAPTVLNIMTSSYAGTYGAGERIFFLVRFSAPVVVQGDDKYVRLLLAVGRRNAAALYYSGSGSEVLSFRYTVEEGDETDDLGPFSATALRWGGAASSDDGDSSSLAAVRAAAAAQIVDVDLPLNASFALRSAGAANLSTDGGAVVVETAAPAVAAVRTAKVNGTYGAGEEIMLFVDFTHAVEACGTPELALNSGGVAILTERGTVQAVDVLPDADADRAAGRTVVETGEFRLAWGGDTTACIAVGDADAAIAALRALPGLGGSGSGSSSSYSSSGYGSSSMAARGGGFRMTVTFAGGGDGAYERYPGPLSVPWNWDEGCEPLRPALTVVPRRAATETLSFLYTVAEGDAAVALDASGVDALTASNGGWIRRAQSAAVTNANLTLPDAAPLTTAAAAPVNITVDTTPPGVWNVTSLSGAGPFLFGDKVFIRIWFSLPVKVILSGGSGPQLSLIVSTSTVVGITAYTTADAAFAGGGVTDFASTGTADAAAVAAAATAAKETATALDDSVLLVYVVGADDSTDPLEYVSTAALAGEIRRASSNPTTAADLALPAPDGGGILADAAAVAAGYDGGAVVVAAADEATRVQNVTAVPAAAALVEGGTVAIYVYFTRPVRYTDDAPPTLALLVGPRGSESSGEPTAFEVACTAPASADVFSESFLFNYTVQPRQRTSLLTYDGDHALAASVGAGSGTSAALWSAPSLEDAWGNAANATLPPPGTPLALDRTSAISVDTSCRILFVTVLNPNGTYYAGASVWVAVRYSNAVAVRGVPRIALRAGDPKKGFLRRALYSYGSGTDTLVFEYVVQPGDKTIDLDYDGIGAEAVPTAGESGTGSGDGSGSDVAAVFSASAPEVRAAAALPAVWTAGTIGARKDIAVSTDMPVVLRTWTDTANGTYGVGESIDVHIVFSTPIYVRQSLALPYLRMGIVAAAVAGGGSSLDRRALYVGGNMTDTLTFRYVVAEGDAAPLLDYLDTRAAGSRQRFSEALVR